MWMHYFTSQWEENFSYVQKFVFYLFSFLIKNRYNFEKMNIIIFGSVEFIEYQLRNQIELDKIELNLQIF